MYMYIYISHGEDENTRTRVKTKVYELQLKLDRNQTAKTKTCAFTLNESNLRIHSNIMCFLLNSNYCTPINAIDLVIKINYAIHVCVYNIMFIYYF